MTWKFRHWLFGTHFVAMHFGWTLKVRAIKWTPAGDPYVTICGEMHFLIGIERDWRALTFDKTKWLADRIDAAGHPLPKLRSVK